MKNFFKPEDFGHEGLYDTDSRASEIANKKLNALIESAPLVYCSKPDKENSHLWSHHQTKGYDTHTARLILIEEIKKECVKHEPWEDEIVGSHRIICKHCRVELIPEWKVKP